MTDVPAPYVTYPTGLRLTGRRVVVVGGGHVAQRRIPALLAVGADVVLVSPEATTALEGLGEQITWRRRPYAEGDLDDAWYAIAATDDPSVNSRVAVEAEGRRIFCARADDATTGTAFTPAVGRHEEVTVAVLGTTLDARDPQRSAAVRDAVMAALREGRLPLHRPAREPGVLPGVVLVGGGPGEPDLVTVAGRQALREADVVVADRLAPQQLLGELSPDVELVDVSKLPRGRHTTQDEINRVVLDRALAGKRVVRFKGGDSYVFGRGYEEVQACREAGLPVTVVPGVTSPVSVPEAAGIPVTHRGVAHEFTVISGHLPPGHPESLVEWGAVARLRGTVVLMMAVQNLAAIADVLVAGGRAATTPVAVVCEGTMPGERTVLSTLGEVAADLATHDVRPPAVVVVGEVVAVAHPERYPRD